VFAGAIALAAAVGLTACGDDSSGEGGSGSGQIELSIGTFTEFGYEDLLKEYESLNPNIKITHHKTGQGGPYHQQLLTKLAAREGLEDVVAIEEGHLPDVIDKPQLFNNLAEIGPKDATPERWLDWKYQQGVAKDGTWIGYGTDIGPLAMCYRKDLLEAAGMATDDASVKGYFATWDSYFAAGDQFVGASGGKAWYDSNSQVFNAMQNQLDEGYLTKDDELAIESNTAIKKNFDQVTAAGERGQTAKLAAFSPEWNTGFKEGAFATKTCPSWMLGVVKEQAGPENAGKWAVTDAFPNGGGNWGGSFLAVPKQSQHPEEAAKLAAWLTAPEQQIKAFEKTGNFPSQVDALTAPELLEPTNDYFGVKAGQLFATMAQKVSKAQYKGPGDGKIQENAMSPALQAVEQGKTPEEGWSQAVEAAEKIVK
jgi:cellobiose transport system substrate-binding protein